MINVMLVDDHAVLRDGLKNIFEMEDDIQVVGEAVNGNEALEVLKEMKPDVVLLDINLPDKNGVELTAIFKRDYPNVKVLILTMHSMDEYFMAAIREGADGYLLKDAPSVQVVEAIRTVAKGESIIDPSLTKKLLGYYNQKNETTDKSELTEREKEVLICLVDGLSNKEIGERLFISDKTVKIHVSKIFKKINVKSRSQAVIYAVQNQLVPLP
ncbi:response regulator transcription factor [Alkalihalobacillus sp. TS-13]|uniref:response regulator n=1 Tax=Alkalihalobacillus sp. TS-13 TaxID=2842455 RepID=UPI001C882465|nr:response regulator transcription factor [Alkalihalobacillus sp. TS-13]